MVKQVEFLARLGELGRITIPVELREFLGLEVGDMIKIIKWEKVK